jgi:hypothetical protein
MRIPAEDQPFLGIKYSLLVHVADAQPWSKKTYNNAISALHRAFNFGYLDYPERRDPAAALKCSRIGTTRLAFRMPKVLIAAIHREWGELQGNYDELRFFTDLPPSEEIALVVTDYDRRNAVLSVTKARVLPTSRLLGVVSHTRARKSGSLELRLVCPFD